MKGTRNIAGWLTAAAALTGWIGAASCRATVAGDPDRPIKIEAHITLDVRQVKETASSIEDMVSGKAPAPQKTSRLSDWTVPSAWAAGPELKFVTPEVQRALDARRDRFGRLKEFKAQGLIGEDNQGHVAALGGGADVQALVEEENRDRELIYRTIVEQNNLSSDSITTIRTAFAEVQREKADPGEKIQNPSGDWTAR